MIDRQRKERNEQTSKLAAAMEVVKAAKGVNAVVKELLKEHGRATGTTNWGIVNDTLVALDKALSALLLMKMPNQS